MDNVSCGSLKLIVSPEQILFFTGEYAEGWLLIDDCNQSTLFTDSRYYYAVNQAVGGSVKVICWNGNGDAEKYLKGRRVGVDFGTLTVKEYREIESLGAALYDASADINGALAIKSPAQLALIKRACEIAETAYGETLGCIKEGVTELDVSAELEYRFKKHGASGVSFETIVAFGGGSAVPHHKTGDIKLEPNSAVLMDFGCVYKGFMSDMTRTAFFGEPSEEFLSAYGAVKRAHELAAEKISAGMTGCEADKIARDYLDGLDLSKYFTHSLGHGIGTVIHEFPTVSPKGKAVLKDGMVFSIEPGVYFDGRFGIRIEDTVTLADGRVKSMMTADKELKIIG